MFGSPVYAFGTFGAYTPPPAPKKKPFDRFDSLMESLFPDKPHKPSSVARKLVPVYITYETSESMNTRIAALEKMEKMRKELDDLKKWRSEIEVKILSGRKRKTESDADSACAPPSKRRCSSA